MQRFIKKILVPVDGSESSKKALEVAIAKAANANLTVLEGYPADTIVETATKGNYDMIVIGSRGLSAVGRFLVGSVSDRIVHHATCSVTVVR